MIEHNPGTVSFGNFHMRNRRMAEKEQFATNEEMLEYCFVLTRA